jgi:hypothetical protein
MSLKRGVLIAAIAMGASPVLAASNDSDALCQSQGEVAHKASELRLAGKDKESAEQALLRWNQESDNPLTGQNVRGLVMVSYMAKMKPAKMREYAIDQCRKNQLK